MAMKHNRVLWTALLSTLAVCVVTAGCMLYAQRHTPAPKDGAAQETTEETPRSELPEGELNPGHAEPPAELEGFTICIDPGHASSAMTGQEQTSPRSDQTKMQCTGGTSGNYQTEAELNLTVGLMLRDQLTALGAEVVLTRSEPDELVSNVERAQIANEAQADLCIRLHADGSDDPSVRGISMLIPAGTLLGTPEIISPSAEAGRTVLDSVIASTGAPSRGLVERSDLTGFNWSEVPCILIEMGFMSNPEEDKLLASEQYQKKLCNGIAEGIRCWLLQESLNSGGNQI